LLRTDLFEIANVLLQVSKTVSAKKTNSLKFQAPPVLTEFGEHKLSAELGGTRVNSLAYENAAITRP
jgi:hypothetical protein